MKSPETSVGSRSKKGNSPERARALRAAKRMGRMVREEHRRYGLPMIVVVDGKIRSVPA